MTDPDSKQALARDEGPGELADRIAGELQPKTVLEIGCRSGNLVAALRERGIEAEGIEQSPRHLQDADPGVQQFLQQARYTQPLEKDYDLILFANEWETEDIEDAEAILANVCAHTADILLAADPASPVLDDIRRRMHRQGFFRDVHFDERFVFPWAVRYRRMDGGQLTDLLETYERQIRALRSENRRLGEQVLQKEAALDGAEIENHPLVQTLTARLQQWEAIWADNERSLGWKLVHQARRIRLTLAPPGSRRAAFLLLARDSLRALRSEGPSAFVQRWRTGLRSMEWRRSVGQKSTAQLNAERYPEFVERTRLSADDLERQRAESLIWEWRPLVSFITPVYNPPVEVLKALLDSVLAQTYDRWELCVADASLLEPQVRALLEDYAGRDERIRVRLLQANLGICGNSNAALEMAAGEFVAILDHDDTLAPEMLFEVVRRIRSSPATDVVYFDEDKLSADGTKRRDPFFKPDFSPEMLLSANYLMHAVFRRSLVEDAGGFDPDFEGCQDWDLAFKVTEQSRNVEHIPRVLYHWRQTPGSTAGEFGAKAYVFERQLACVRNHLVRTGLTGAMTEFPQPGFLRATWPASGRKVSIIIPSKDKVKFLKRTIESIRSVTQYPDYEILVVDNGSRERSTLAYYEHLTESADVRIVPYNEPFNYSRANNLGAAHAAGDIFLFLNNDVEILLADWLEELVRWADRPEIGVVGAKLLYPDNLVQHAGVIVGMEGHASHVFWGYRKGESGPFGSADWYRNFTAITGACMMVRRDTFEEVGGFSEKYMLAFSDIEFCIRTNRHGYRVMYTPHSVLHHFEGRSRGDHIPTIDVRVGIEDFLPIVEAGDPFYNPNLSYVERKPAILPAQEEDRVSRLMRVAASARADELVRPAENA